MIRVIKKIRTITEEYEQLLVLLLSQDSQICLPLPNQVLLIEQPLLTENCIKH